MLQEIGLSNDQGDSRDSNRAALAVMMATRMVGRPNLKSNVDAVSSTAAESAMPSTVHRPERVNTGTGTSTAIASRSGARCARRNTTNGAGIASAEGCANCANQDGN